MIFYFYHRTSTTVTPTPPASHSIFVGGGGWNFTSAPGRLDFKTRPPVSRIGKLLEPFLNKIVSPPSKTGHVVDDIIIIFSYVFPETYLYARVRNSSRIIYDAEFMRSLGCVTIFLSRVSFSPHHYCIIL